MATNATPARLDETTEHEPEIPAQGVSKVAQGSRKACRRRVARDTVGEGRIPVLAAAETIPGVRFRRIASRDPTRSRFRLRA
jgi:hypothetical protein